MAFSGHKGLVGPTGTGGLYIRDGVMLSPLLRGGTGSDSAHETQPQFLPDMLESGTLNVAGIAGLGAGVRYLQEIGIEAVTEHGRKLVAKFVAGLHEIPGINVYGPTDVSKQCGVVSFKNIDEVPSDDGLDRKSTRLNYSHRTNSYAD